MIDYHFRILVGVVGLIALVHLICTANFLKPKSSPAFVTLSIAFGCGFSVGIIHSAIIGDTFQMLIYSALCLASVLAFNLGVWFYGMHVCDHFERMMKNEAK